MLIQLLKFADISTLLLSVGILAFVHFVANTRLTILEFLTIRIQLKNFIFVIGMIMIWHFIFASFRLYDSRRLSGQLEEIIDILKAISVATGFAWVLGTIFSVSVLQGVGVLWFWLISTSMTVFLRVQLRWLLKKIRISGRNLRKILVVGTNTRAKQFSQQINERPELGYVIIGFLDDMDCTPSPHIKLLGRLDDFSKIVRKLIVDEIFIFLPVRSFYDNINKITKVSEEQGITVRFPNDLFNLRIAKSKAEIFHQTPLTTVYSVPIGGKYVIIKGIVDFIISGVCLILSLPIFVIVALAIKLDSPGPVFFVQKRVGLNKRIFKLLKFRTMVDKAQEMQSEFENLNEMDGAAFKIKDDPRVTRVGKIIRKTSLDELPQLINVLRGDMSLVGPRPLPLRDVKRFELDWHRRRFSVKPGITCLWQVNGRNNTSFEEWMKLDMQYIDEWSLWLDLKILSKTVPVVLRGSGV